MAAQLVAAGAEVTFLALLESRLRLTRLRLELTTDEDLLRVFLRDHELDGADDTASGRPERALAQARLRGIVPAQLSVAEFVEVATRYGAAFRDNVDLARRYKPSGSRSRSASSSSRSSSCATSASSSGIGTPRSSWASPSSCSRSRRASAER